MYVHNGETILFFMNDNPITLEALIYGAVSSVMLVSVLMWCSCYSVILTTDKFLYLFGKTVPKLGLILSMAFRMIPLFQLQSKKIRQSQKSMGLYATDAVVDKAGGSFRVFDSLLTWSMENAVDTADAMKARGYGLKGRTNFSLFRFRRRDGIMLGVMAFFTAVIVGCFALGGFSFYYYPYVAKMQTTPVAIVGYAAVFLFLLLPGAVEERGKCHGITGSQKSEFYISTAAERYDRAKTGAFRCIAGYPEGRVYGAVRGIRLWKKYAAAAFETGTCTGRRKKRRDHLLRKGTEHTLREGSCL